MSRDRVSPNRRGLRSASNVDEGNSRDEHVLSDLCLALLTVGVPAPNGLEETRWICQTIAANALLTLLLRHDPIGLLVAVIPVCEELLGDERPWGGIRILRVQHNTTCSFYNRFEFRKSLKGKIVWAVEIEGEGQPRGWLVCQGLSDEVKDEIDAGIRVFVYGLILVDPIERPSSELFPEEITIGNRPFGIR